MSFSVQLMSICCYLGWNFSEICVVISELIFCQDLALLFYYLPMSDKNVRRVQLELIVLDTDL